MATIQLTMLAETAAMRKGIDDVNSRLGTMSKTAGTVGRAIKGLAVGFVAFKAAGAIADSVREASSAIAEQDKLLAQTNAVLKSTGGAAGVATKDILNMSNAIERKSMIDAEQIQTGQNMLLTFTNIRNEAGKGNDVFNQTTQAMADLSTAMGQSTKSSALQLGKALNDPIKGISALSRVGVSFTEQQKEQVEALVESGNTMGAQKVILAELTKQFGGSAKAAGDTFAGKVKHLKDIWDGFVESLVRKAIPTLTRIVDYLSKNLPAAIAAGSNAFNKVKAAVGPFLASLVTAGVAMGKAILPTLKQIGSIVTGTVLPALGSFAGFLKNNTDLLVALGAGLAAAKIALIAYNTYVKVTTAVTKAWAVVQKILNGTMKANPIGLVITAIGLLVAGLVLAYKKSQTFRNIVNKTWNAIKVATKAVFGVVKTIIVTTFNAISGVVKSVTKAIASAVKATWNAIRTATKVAWNLIKNTVLVPLRLLLAAVRGDTGAMKGIITSAWNFIKSATSRVWNGIKTAVTTALTAVVNAVKGLQSKVTGALSSAGSWLLDAGRQIIQGLLDGIGSMIGAVQDKLKVLTDMIPDWKGPRERDRKLLRPAGQLIMKGLIDGFEDGRDGIKKSLGEVTDLIEKFYDKRFKKNDKLAKKFTNRAIKRLGNETKALMKNAKKREQIYAKLAKARERLEDIKKSAADYKKSVVEGVMGYTNITGLDAAFNAPALLAELQKRLEKVRQFSALIKQLVSSGLNQTAISQLVAAGVEGGLAYAQAIASGGPEAITEFNALQEQINAAANGLGNTAADDMYGAGIAAAQGLIKGLQSQRKKLQQFARQLAKDLVKAIKDELQIKSPSRVFKAIGEFTIAGLTEGLADTRGLSKAMGTVSDVMTGSIAPVTTSTGGRGRGDIHIHVSAPVNVDKRAVAREIKNALMTLDTSERRVLVS